MAIHVRRKHTHDRETIRRIVDEVAEELAQDLHVHYRWEGDRLTFERIGVHGYIDTAREGELEVYIKKNFLLPFPESWLREHVEQYLERHLS